MTLESKATDDIKPRIVCHTMPEARRCAIYPYHHGLTTSNLLWLQPAGSSLPMMWCNAEGVRPGLVGRVLHPECWMNCVRVLVRSQRHGYWLTYVVSWKWHTHIALATTHLTPSNPLRSATDIYCSRLVQAAHTTCTATRSAPGGHTAPQSPSHPAA